MTEKYDLKALKAALLKSDDHVIETQIFGAKAFIRRLKAAELQENEDGMKAAIDSGDMNKAAQLNVQLLLSCLMTPDGKRIPAGALPSVDDLLAAHDNPTLVEAIGAGLARCGVLEVRAPTVLEGNFDPGFMIRLHLKDLRLALAGAFHAGRRGWPAARQDPAAG